MSATVEPILRVDALVKEFPARRRGLRRSDGPPIIAVGGVSFDVERGEKFGLVGESGCGKSTIARCVLRLATPTAGQVHFDGIDLETLSDPELRALRRRMQIVHQDPTGSLDPRMSIGETLREPLRIHGLGTASSQRERMEDALALVGLDTSVAGRRPHEFSGGQRQRIGIARALTLEPELVVLDEPVSALDVSIQAQVLNLLQEVQDRLGLTYLFIVHDLAVAEHFCDRLAVLYLGHVMETGTREQLFNSPLHPYTVALLSAVPVPDPAAKRSRPRIILKGDVESAPSGGRRACPFQPRCPVGRDRPLCKESAPPLARQPSGQLTACHYPGEALA